MNILFVCHRLPFPPDRGGRIRPFHMIRHLARNHAVTVVCPAVSQREIARAAGLRDYCAEIITEVLPPRVRWLQAFAALPTAEPSSVAYFRSARLLRRVREHARAARFDAVLVHCAFAAPCAKTVAAGRRLLDFGDLDSGKWLAYAQQHRFPLSWGYAIEARKLRRYERRLAGEFDHCMVTTASELDDLRLRVGTAAPCSVIANGVDTSYFTPLGAAPPLSRAIIFLGRMHYFPNVQGATWFARQVFPRIRAAVPDATFRIVGANPGWRVRRLARADAVAVTGYVPDVRPHLRDAAVAVAPLSIARGTQNKILEAMAAGVPVVSSTLAAKGVQAVPGRDLLVADAPEDFAAQVVGLLRDPELRHRLAESARAQVERTHSWPASLQRLDALLDARGW